MPELPVAGDDFAGYKILGTLGKGRTSVVYQAGNPRLGNVIALKVLVPELAGDDTFRTRFFEESRIAAALNHPNVVPIHDMGSAGGLLYITMRQVSGTDLRRLLGEAGRLPPGRAVALLTQAARALDAAHRKGLVHRDVKPGNLLVERGREERGREREWDEGREEADPDHVYLTDFGITKVMSSRTGLTSAGEFVGTVDYIAPEQIRGISVMGMADQYSLGCVLYECLTGLVPFRKDLDAAVIFAHVEEEPPPPSAVRPGLPPAIDAVIARSLAKQPGDRYGSCREFMAAAADALLVPPVRAEATASRPDRGAAPRPEAEDGHQASLRAGRPLPAPYASAEVAHGGDTGAAWRDFSSIREELQAALSVRDEPALRDSVRGEPADGDKPGGGRPARHGRRWPAAAAAVVLAGAGAATWFLVRGPGATARAGAAPVSMSSPMPSHGPSPLMAAIAQANTITSKVPPSQCTQQGTTQVTCTAPAPGVSEAIFRTYPSLGSLYAAYETAMKSLDGGRVVQDSRNCADNAPPTTGAEVGWNHQFKHPKDYTIAQMAAGGVGVAEAAGRVFCVLDSRTGMTDFVWTQDDGHVLGWVAGPLHEQVWHWWVTVHHEIAIGKPPMTMPSMGTMPG